MKRRDWSWMVPLVCVVVLGAGVWVSSASPDSQQVTSIRKMPCPHGAWCGQEPPAGPMIVTDKDPESDAALTEIKEVLSRKGCQLAYRERVNEDGTRTPRIVVERVMYFIAMP